MDASQPLIDRLQLSGWRQFQDVDIAFDPRLTILTGQNGAGKTTILNVLAPSVGWSVPMAVVPHWTSMIVKSIVGVWQRVFGQASAVSDTPMETIGRLTYGGGLDVDVQIPVIAVSGSFTSFTVRYAREVSLPGLYIPSHRPIYLPTMAQRPSASAWRREAAFQVYVDRIRPQWTGEVPQYFKGQEMASALSALKEVLCTIPRFSEGGSDDDFTVAGFEEKLKIVLPSSLGFESLLVENNEVGLVAESGAFALDAVSGGIAAVIDMTWQLFTYPSETGRFVALIDEPENHLHPEMQQTILPNLLKAFPHVQFIVSTHAPLVVTSVRDCTVYGFWYDYEKPDDAELVADVPQEESETNVKRIVCKEIVGFAKAGTPDDTLRRVLGLDYTMPHWAAQQLTEEVENIAREGVTVEELRETSVRLHESGLGQYVGDALTMARERIKVAKSAQYEEYAQAYMAEEAETAVAEAEEWPQ